MAGWGLEDIPWEHFDSARVDPAIVPVVKAASLVEYNAGDYRTYLINVFDDDSRFRSAVTGWAEEEVQHGEALARWARLADPDFDFDAAFTKFLNGFRVPLKATKSVRGSRSGELLARCIVETGTTGFYSALADATDEPVLRAICRRIAEDEYAHYCLFHGHMTRYFEREGLGFWARLRIALQRIGETEDDELAYAYYAANGAGASYDRRRDGGAYVFGVLSVCTPRHVERIVGMVFRALGIRFGGIFGRIVTALAWRLVRMRRTVLRRAIA